MRAEPFSDTELTHDRILGGRVALAQPKDGYRAGVDPVLLAATVPAQNGQTILELGCGAAPALCCLGVRVPGLRLIGLEQQPAYADLARRNLASNGLEGVVHQSDLRAPPAALRTESAHHVIANPPYFEPARRVAADDTGREESLAGPTPLAEWVSMAARRLKPKGYATFIQRVERVPELLTAFDTHLGSVELWPLLPRAGRAPRLILIRGRKDGHAPFRLHAGLILHQGLRHEADKPDYAPPVFEALHNAKALDFPA